MAMTREMQQYFDPIAEEERGIDALSFEDMSNMPENPATNERFMIEEPNFNQLTDQEMRTIADLLRSQNARAIDSNPVLESFIGKASEQGAESLEPNNSVFENTARNEAMNMPFGRFSPTKKIITGVNNLIRFFSDEPRAEAMREAREAVEGGYDPDPVNKYRSQFFD